MMDKEKQEGMLSKKEGWGVIWKELLVRERERERESVCVSKIYKNNCSNNYYVCSAFGHRQKLNKNMNDMSSWACSAYINR